MRLREMTVVLAVAFVTTCSSSSGLNSQVIEGGPGQPIVVSIAGVDTGIVVDREGARQYDVQVEVSNDAEVPLTVTRISIVPVFNGAFQIQSASQTFNEMIDPGKDHLFEMRVTGRQVRPFGRNEANVVQFGCIVTLSNGDAYHYTFEGPVRETP